MTEQSIFNFEENILKKCNTVLSDEKFTDNALRPEYDTLTQAYNKLFSHCKRLIKIGDKQQQRLTDNAQELREMNSQLEKTLAALKDTQTQLVQSEKLASLGQITATVAHEINTPLGAINAALGNIAQNVINIGTSQKSFTNVTFTAPEKDLFYECLQLVISRQLEGERLSTMEKRKKAKEIKELLKEKGFDDDKNLAKEYANLNVDELIPQLIDLVQGKQIPEILTQLTNLSNLAQSVRDMQSSTAGINQLVRALKSYAYLDQAQIDRIDIHEGIETNLTLMKKHLETGITVQKEFSELPKINCYVNELNLVWTNIIMNAVQAMNGRGQLTICTSVKDEDLSITFTDTGSGIPSEIQEKIFEPFFTTEAQNQRTGMGLSIARKIIEKHDGTITVNSQPGKTTFEILLPIHALDHIS